MEAETRLAHAIEQSDRDAHERAHAVSARAFRAIIMLVDRTDLRTLALALEAAVDGVEKAAREAQALHASAAPEDLRLIARTITRAADGLRTAVPHVGRSATRVMEATAEVRRLKEQGREQLDAGLGKLFAGAPDAVEVIRWKDMYEKLSQALACCVKVGDALERVTSRNS